MPLISDVAGLQLSSPPIANIDASITRLYGTFHPNELEALAARNQCKPPCSPRSALAAAAAYMGRVNRAGGDRAGDPCRPGTFGKRRRTGPSAGRDGASYE